MATNIIDPVTGIVIPTPGEEPGENYAVDISNALSTLAHLTHTGASNQDGYQIPSAGINFNADISAQSNNLTSLRSTRYTSQSSTLSGVGDVNCLYFSGGNAFVNNGSGVPIQITAGTSLDVTVSNTLSAHAISANYTINPSDGYAILLVNTSAARVITMPVASTVAAGRFYIIKDVSGTANTNNITINHQSSDLIDGVNPYVINTNYGVVELISDGVSNWEVFRGAQLAYNNTEALAFNSGSALNLNAGSATTMANTATLEVKSGAIVEVDIGGQIALAGQLNITSSGIIEAASGGQIAVDSGATFVLNGDLHCVNGTGTIHTDGSAILIQDGTYPTFVTAQTVKRNCAPRVIGNLQSNWSTWFNGPYAALWVPSTTSTQIVILELPYLLDGMVLNSVTCYLNIGTTHSGLPASGHFPSLDVRCTNTTTAAVPGPDYSMRSSGAVYATAGSVSAYDTLTSFVFTTNQLNTIDHTNYMYYMILKDEEGVSSEPGNIYFGFQLNYTVTSMKLA
jgi:hypothetical protein